MNEEPSAAPPSTQHITRQFKSQTPNHATPHFHIGLAMLVTSAQSSPSSSATCFFTNCDHPALPGSSKCSLHKHRTKCMVDRCANQVYARSLCVRHGGKKKCRFEDCHLNARIGEFCSKHGGKSYKAICIHEGCTKQAHKRKKCVRHGGGRKCNVEGCDVHARRGGFCARHGRQFSNGNLAPTSPATTDDTQVLEKVVRLPLPHQDDRSYHPPTHSHYTPQYHSTSIPTSFPPHMTRLPPPRGLHSSSFPQVVELPPPRLLPPVKAEGGQLPGLGSFMHRAPPPPMMMIIPPVTSYIDRLPRYATN
ncbi:hypothetical protein Ae201684_004208 [Aphanomyces euteiches]|uniref:Uncharacterized protein n=1 Tax=Aphanomyces euteiches TaxID=100861 RepID=A0A6G0XJS5_9STRA|nr:hypothetical protein Ae201684_004208 [Aphanomyces euteiches]